MLDVDAPPSYKESNIMVSGRRFRAALVALLAAVSVLAAGSLTTSSSTAQAADPPRSLWFGDSIFEGCCQTSSTAPSMPRVAAARLGLLNPIIKGSWGTGYLNPGPAGSGKVPYPARIGPVLDANPNLRLLVIEGGVNDPAASDLVTFRAAVRKTFDIAKAKTAPYGTRIIVLGPYSANGGSSRAALRQVLLEETSRAGLRYIDMIALGWTSGFAAAGRLHTDNFHPNAAGHRFLGNLLAGELALKGAPEHQAENR